MFKSSTTAILDAALAAAIGCSKPAVTSGPGANTPAPGATGGPGGGKAADGPAAANPEFKTTDEALVKEMLADEKAFLAKYKDKVVEVEGPVQFANKIIGNNGSISLAGAKKKPADVVSVTVICVPTAAELEKAWWLGRGEKVKVVGRLIGASSFPGISLDRCTITEVGPNPTPRVAADALVAEFVKDPEAAKAKYTQSEYVMKEAIVEGTVAGTAVSPDGAFSFIDLAGGDGATVRFTVDKADKESVKKGDKVTMKGDLSLFDPAAKRLTVNTAFVLKRG